MRRTTRRLRGAAFLGLLGLLACATPVEYHGRKVGGGFILWSVPGEISMGREAIAELEAEGLPYLQEPTVQATLDRITNRLMAAVPPTFPKYPFNFAVIDDCVVNAFALPGGPIRIHRGLLVKTVETEAELAGVLAHEMGHVLGRHGSKRVSDLFLKLGLLAAVVTVADEVERGNCRSVNRDECQQTWSQVIGVVGYLGVVLSSLAYSRDNENEADWIGTHLMIDAGYDPEGMARVFDKFAQMKAEKGVSETAFLNRILSTHPPSADRAVRVRQLRTERGAARTDWALDTPAFARLRQDLRRLPPPAYEDAMTTLTCSAHRRTCGTRREECYRRLLVCQREECDTIREQCVYIENECAKSERECRAFEQAVRGRRPSC
ncbi:MAG: M48 family metalloprotease [Acidobacteria bacterium]|nr:M48 family metalloprotease [Acidobacteriota bacterium]MDW7984304.1 M48 family metalloprotease [Acidobacteriota bacterium]